MKFLTDATRRIKTAVFESRVVTRSIMAATSLVCLYVYSGKLIRDPTNGDFGVFLNAARVFLLHGNIYEVSTNPGSSAGLFYLYPPLLAFLLTPFVWLPNNALIVIWTALNIFLIGWIIKQSVELFTGSSFSDLDRRQQICIWFFPLLLNGRFILNNLQRGQVNILEVALVVLSLILFKNSNKKGSGYFAGAILGFSIVIKPLTAPFVLLFASGRRVFPVIGIAFGVALGLIIPSLLLGFDENYAMLKYWVDHFLLAPERVDASLLLRYDFSIRGQMYRFFHSPVGFEIDERSYSLMLFPLASNTIEATDWVIRVGLLLPVVHFWRKYRSSPTVISHYGLAALLFAMTPFYFPTAQMSYFVFLLPACIYVTFVRYIEGAKDRVSTILIALSFLFSTVFPDRNLPYSFGIFALAAGCYLVGATFLTLAVFRSASLLSRRSN